MRQMLLGTKGCLVDIGNGHHDSRVSFVYEANFTQW